jgi:16S rRNA pseudouridine516 synthase
MRLDRLVGEALSSRSRARALIAEGRVRVNGAPVKNGAYNASEADLVTLDGAVIGKKETLHLMLNKPAGVVTARSDARFKTVFDALDANLRTDALSAVGRLDRDVTGLLLLTEDGQLAHRLISPRFLVPKVYIARVEGRLTPGEAQRAAQGIALSDFTARPAQLEILEASGVFSIARLTLTEGKFHQVKRMFGALGHPVQSLERKSVGGVALDESLAPGEFRRLSQGEIARLYALTGLNP